MPVWQPADSLLHSGLNIWPFSQVVPVSTATAPQVHTPIAGVAPAEIKETVIMTVWPSNTAYGLGRVLGGLYAWRFPDVYIFRIGNLIALASIPIALLIYLAKVLPFIAV